MHAPGSAAGRRPGAGRAVGRRRVPAASRTGVSHHRQTHTSCVADGRQPVTSAGHPLYYFANDAAQGDPVHVDDIRGAGQKQFGGTWSAVSASGAPVASNGSTIVPD